MIRSSSAALASQVKNTYTQFGFDVITVAAIVDFAVVVVIVCEFVCLHVLDMCVCMYQQKASNVCKFTYNESGLVGQSRAEL